MPRIPADRYTWPVAELTERAVSARVPPRPARRSGWSAGAAADGARGDHARGAASASWEASGTGDSVFVTDARRRPAGVLTERDIFGRLVGGPVDLDAPVETFMNRPAARCARPDVRDALELMQSGRYRNVPLVDDDGRLVGVVRQVDILKYLAEAFPQELLNLPPRPHQRMEQAEGA